MGQTQVSRAEFDTLYHLTRQQGFTEQYINAGWQRSGLWPINRVKVLGKPEISRYRQTTPDLAPPQTSQNLTPQDKWEYDRINETLAAKLTRSGRKLLKSLNHAYQNESNARITMSVEISESRKRARDEEEKASMKRLKKEDEKRSWNAKDVALARGYSQEDSDLFLSVLPDRTLIYNVDESEDT